MVEETATGEPITIHSGDGWAYCSGYNCQDGFYTTRTGMWLGSLEVVSGNVAGAVSKAINPRGYKGKNRPEGYERLRKSLARFVLEIKSNGYE